MMKYIQYSKVIVLDIHHKLLYFVHIMRRECMSKHNSEIWEQLHLLSLVIDKLGLFFHSTDVAELPSYG